MLPSEAFLRTRLAGDRMEGWEETTLGTECWGVLFGGGDGSRWRRTRIGEDILPCQAVRYLVS